MKLIEITKLTGAKRLHRKYEVLNGEKFTPSFPFEYEKDSNYIFEFKSDFEDDFKKEVEEYKQVQIKEQSVEMRKVNKTSVIEVAQEQGSDKLVKSRLGAVTASDTPLTNKGFKIPTYWSYVYKKVAESIRAEKGIKKEAYSNETLDRGNELEPFARERYTEKTGVEIIEKGFMKAKNMMVGASPDGIAIDENMNAINIEIKSVFLQTYLAQIDRNKVVESYFQQMQIQMFILNVDMTHMLIQCQEEGLIDLPLIIVEVPRDEVFISNAIDTIKEFEKDFKMVESKFNENNQQ